MSFFQKTGCDEQLLKNQNTKQKRTRKYPQKKTDVELAIIQIGRLQSIQIYFFFQLKDWGEQLYSINGKE
jgi:hypothetical protein